MRTVTGGGRLAVARTIPVERLAPSDAEPSRCVVPGYCMFDRPRRGKWFYQVTAYGRGVSYCLNYNLQRQGNATGGTLCCAGEACCTRRDCQLVMKEIIPREPDARRCVGSEWTAGKRQISRPPGPSTRMQDNMDT